MNGDLQDLTYNFLKIALCQHIQAVADGDFDTVWDNDVRDGLERICQIVMALGVLHQMAVPV